jgi:NADH oxidase (H2O2-forming)
VKLHTVIIGNGIAGVTAARELRKRSDQKITLVSSESKYFFSRTALMYVYMGHLRFCDIEPYEATFWKKNRLQLVHERVTTVDSSHQVVTLSSGKEMQYTSLVLATGSQSSKFGWKGQDLKGVQGLYFQQDLVQMEENTQGVTSAVVVGGGLIGIELVEMLLSRRISVHFLVRESHFWSKVLSTDDSSFVMRTFGHHGGLTIHCDEELQKIVGDEKGKVKEVITKKGKTISCEFVGLATGVRPSIDFLSSSGIETDQGVLVNRFLETSCKNVYAIGDCAQMREPISGRNAIEQLWYTGKIMGETVAATIAGKPTEYRPGNWFNSAKFFDLEYQTYGEVPNVPREGLQLFSWEHSSKTVRMTFAFEATTQVFKGVNSFGIRLRHSLLDEWLRKEETIEFVLKHLASALFDPEFSRDFSPDVLQKYNRDFSCEVKKSVKKQWWEGFITKQTNKQ